MPDHGQHTHVLPVRFLEWIGGRALDVVSQIGMVWLLLVDASRWIIRRVTQRRVKIGRAAVVAQIVRVGVAAIFIVSLVSGSIGYILALQMAPPLEQLGQVHLVPNIVAVAVLRELGPLMAGIVMVGFAGAAISAEIGTMVVGEEVEALQAHALNPVRFLVVPRVIATVISMVCLAVISDIVAVGAASVVCNLQLGISWNTFFSNTQDQVGPRDFLTGIAKAGFFGLIIGLIACGNGLKVSGGAAGVGSATTKTVVQSILAIIFADLIFTSIFYSLGLV